MRRIMIIGGYGAVGREAAGALTRWFPDVDVIVAGRDPATAAPVPGTIARRLDATDDHAIAEALEGVDTVLMCVESGNARLARMCVERGVHYLDVTATYSLLAQFETLDEPATAHGATVVLSVGLVPGVTNLLARHCAERAAAQNIRIGVLLGTGERHGPAATRWTVDRLGELAGSWRMRFPAPHGRRTVHRFPFSDQFTLPRTLGVARVETGLCLDTRGGTAFLAAASRPVVARLLRRPRVNRALLTALNDVHLGGDGFAVSATAGTVHASLSGQRQSRATGLIAALLVRRLPMMPAGVRHIEQVVDPVGFLTDLAALGYVLDLGS